MRAVLEISFRKTVTTGSILQGQRMGCKTCLIVLHIPCSTNSICHFRGEQPFKSADKVAIFKVKLELWKQQKNIGIFEMFQTLAVIWKRWSQGLLSLIWCMITYLSFRKNLNITSQSQNTLELGRNGTVTHLWINQANWGFAGGAVIKNLPGTARHAGSVPGSGRSPGGGNDNPL